MFKIIWADNAWKALKKLDRFVSKRIYNKVGKLKTDPHRYLKKLVGSPYFCLRVGDYRVIVEVRKDVLQILVLKVEHRKRIYKD